MTSEQDLAIRVSHLSKMYKIYTKPADLFWEMVTGKPRYKTFWALKDISFEVPRGSVVGIMGRNGAGKSTLLKIISSTLDKTSGEVTVKGRISSILELGTGFSLENTGRQNVYLGGLMVGMTREEVNQKMDWIIEFSELSSVIDQPFKTYSTGMQARLTFSTAVCIEPDILIVDEALSVGDAKFARKCFAKIEEFRNTSHTILLVSHDINTISNFCDQAILLENGEIYEQGAPFHIGQVYYQLLFASPEDKPAPIRKATQEQLPISSQESDAGDKSPLVTSPGENSLQAAPEAVVEPVNEPNPLSESEEGMNRKSIREAALSSLGLTEAFYQGNPHQQRMGNKKAEILDYGILDEQGKRAVLLKSGKSYRLFSRAVFYQDVRGATWGFVIRNTKGVDLFGTSTLVQKLDTADIKKGAIIEAYCDVTMWLTNGIYFLSVAIADPYAETDVQYDLLYDAYQFDVGMLAGLFTPSIVNLDPQPIGRNIVRGEVKFRPLENYILGTIH